jgi:hypothetical protein
VKVSIPSIIMQMYASGKYGADQFARFDKYTVTMTHPTASSRCSLVREPSAPISPRHRFTNVSAKMPRTHDHDNG